VQPKCLCRLPPHSGKDNLLTRRFVLSDLPPAAKAPFPVSLPCPPRRGILAALVEGYLASVAQGMTATLSHSGPIAEGRPTGRQAPAKGGLVRRLHAALLVLLLYLTTLACGGTSTAPTSAPLATLHPTFTPVSTGAPQLTVAPVPRASEGSGTLDLVSPWPPDDLSSCRLTMRVRVSGTETGEVVDAVLEDSYEVGGQGLLHGTFSYRGTLFEREHESEVYLVGDDTAYAKYDGEWRRVKTLDEVEEYVGGMELQDFVRHVCGWRWQADTEYEGISVQHWTLTTEDILHCKSLAGTDRIGDLVAASGNLLFVPEDNHIVHLDLTLEGNQLQTWLATDGALDKGRLELSYDLSHINQPLNIQVPAEALLGKGPLNLEGLVDLAQAASYRAREQFSLSGTAEAERLEGARESLVEFTSEPKAQHLQVSFRSMNGRVETGDEYQIQGTTYSKVDGVWQRQPTTEKIIPQTSLFEPRRWLDGTCGWRRQADVEYLGVLAHHWTMAKDDGLDCTDTDLMQFGNVTGLSGDLIIAGGSYPLRLELVLEGTGFEVWSAADDRTLDEGQLVIALEIWDVNQPFTIEIPAEALTGKQVLNLDDLVHPAEMTSFRSTTQFRISGTAGGESLEAEHEYLIEFIREPRALHSQMLVRGMHDEVKTIRSDVYELPDTTYTMVDGGWQRQPTTEIWIDGDWIDGQGWLEGTCGWEQQPDMEYEGILAHHWTMTKEEGLTCPSQMTETADLTGFSGDLFVAVDGNYILHLELILEGTDLKGWSEPGDPVLDEGRVVIVLDVKDVNQPLVIQPPEEALSGEEVP
jgi:hypothetical protein